MKKYNLSFYSSIEWSNMRKSSIEQHGECMKCGRKDRLTVHHRHYKNFGGNETFDDLEVLCFSCHNTIHKTDEDYWKSIIARIDGLESALKKERVDFKAFSLPTPPKPLHKQIEELYETLDEIKNNQGRDFVIIHDCFLCPYAKDGRKYSSRYKCSKFGKFGCYPDSASSWDD